MLEQLILGTIQGITEWLPISSEGVITLVSFNFFGATNLTDVIHSALFLHLGTALAGLVYFKKEILKLLKTLFNFKEAEIEYQNFLKFLIISTTISGVIGFGFLQIIDSDSFVFPVQFLNLIIGIFLLITSILLFYNKFKSGNREVASLKNKDSFVLGLVQSLAAFPGLSRSGLTVSTLLFSGFKGDDALRISFIMSLPLVIVGNIILNISEFNFVISSLWGLLASFGFGILTIHILLKIAKKVDFSYFVFVFAILMIGAYFV